MDTQKIKVILSALKHKSLSKAAEENSYTPSAMSHIADSLEQELGVKILERSPRGISLSEEGRVLYDYMVAVVEAEKTLISQAENLISEKEKHLRIGTFSSISQNILPEMIGRFRREHPDIRISVSVEDNLEDWLEDDLVDVIFTDEFTFGNNVWLPIKEDPFVAIVPSDMLKGKRSVTREELYQYTYISINEKILESYFNRDQFANVLDFTSVDNVSVMYMVQQGVGFSVLPSLMINQKPKDVRVLRLNPPISRTVGVAYRANARLTEASKAFIEYLKDKIQSKVL